MRSRRLRRVIVALVAVPAGPLSAQVQVAGSGYDHLRDALQAHAIRLAGPVRIDGVLDEAAWEAGSPITSFTQLDPHEGQPASERTVVRILFDDEALYIGAWLYDRHPVSTRLGRRDMAMSASDWLTVILDSNHDHRTAFGFELNPAGVRRDQTRADQEDDSWEPVWQGAATVADSGWFAEMRIPFSQLRFTGESAQVWGIQVERQIARNQEFSVWAFTPRDEPGGAPRYGHLTGLTEIPTGKRLEVMPYVMTHAAYGDRGGNPFRSDREYSGDVGADVKYRLTSNHTLDATINPDFGQVEVDPAVLNLSAFETFFPERRPFFVEGAELFRFGDDGANSVFYSRRIGRTPSVATGYDVQDVPESTRILGAAKVTGRSAGGWAIGVLDAVTGRETARYETPSGERGRSVVEPLTNYFVGRVRREDRGGETAVGAFVGAVHRDLDSDTIARLLRSAAYSGGIDVTHEWDDRTWTLRAFAATSLVRGEPEVIAATQQLPHRYFQRPDADHLELDATRDALTGFAGMIELSKRIGRHWVLGGSANTVSPGYEVSDLGFQRRADRFDLETSARYTETRPGAVLRRHSAYLSARAEHNYDWNRIWAGFFAGASAQLHNYWSANLDLLIVPGETVDDRLTRGGPAAARPRGIEGTLSVASDDRRRLVAGAAAFVQRGPAASVRELSASLTAKPAPHIELSLGPTYSRSRVTAQYLQTVPDPDAVHTFGARYVFADLDQTTVAVDARLNYTFSPAFTLQLFVQPFLASADFGAAKELTAPGTFDFDVYGRDVGDVIDGRIHPSGQGTGVSFPVPRPDFNLRSLRGNAVLRWEWRPGSTVYVAWQQTRSDSDPIGTFDLGRDARALARAPSNNILLLKVSYWLNP